MKQEHESPRDGQVYLRLRPTSEWVVEWWHEHPSGYVRTAVGSLAEGALLATQVAAARGVAALLATVVGSIHPLP